ncbi:hypothetical protein OIU84_019113 [Salix udensis]|uniref:Uncharacterized protein n=1 Tax=Salix udensis TaxID=889485 RepID=A0AAD6KY39_9ROSI|nr:hypothetical protein OIU84_019113 [Salix udensis]
MGATSTLGVPFLRYVPTKANRNAWKLSKEIHSMILDIVKDRRGSSTAKDILRVILEASHPEWQARARSEVKQVRDGHLPDLDMLAKMKVIKMVVLEVL